MSLADDQNSKLNSFIYVPISDVNQAIVKIGSKSGFTFSLEDLPALVYFATKVLNKHPEMETTLKQVIAGVDNGSSEENKTEVNS